MPYCAHTTDVNFVIRADKLQAMLAKYDMDLEKVGCSVEDIFRGTGFYIEYDTSYDNETHRWTRNGDISIYYEDDSYHGNDTEVFLNNIAPYVEPGSYLAFQGEDDVCWAFYFDGETATEYDGEVYYPGMPGQDGLVIGDGLSIADNLTAIFGSEKVQELPQEFIELVITSNKGSTLEAIADVLFDTIVNKTPQSEPMPVNALATLVGCDSE